MPLGRCAPASVQLWLVAVHAIPVAKYFEYHPGPNRSPKPVAGPLRGTDAWPDLLPPQTSAWAPGAGCYLPTCGIVLRELSNPLPWFL